MAVEARGGASGRFAPLGPEASAVTFDRIARFPEPGWQIPRSVSHSPDGKLVTYLMSEEGGDVMALFAFDQATRSIRRLARAEDLLREQRELSREEELRRERQRQRASGISSYRWARRAPMMIVPHGGDVFVLGGDGKVQRLTDTTEPEIDPKACDGGERVAFARGSELWSIDVATKRETALKSKAQE
jgi:dipeptidyl-peptidase-4